MYTCNISLWICWLLVVFFFWLTCVNKVSLCNDPPASVVRTSGRPYVRTSVRPYVGTSRVCPKNLNVDVFSGTMITTIVKLGTTLHWDKALQGILFWVTFTQGQGPQGLYKILNQHFLSHYSRYSYETWPVGSMWQDLSKHVCEDDLDPNVKVTGDEKSRKNQNVHFLSHYSHYSYETWSLVWDKTFSNMHSIFYNDLHDL